MIAPLHNFLVDKTIAMPARRTDWLRPSRYQYKISRQLAAVPGIYVGTMINSNVSIYAYLDSTDSIKFVRSDNKIFIERKLVQLFVTSETHLLPALEQRRAEITVSIATCVLFYHGSVLTSF